MKVILFLFMLLPSFVHAQTVDPAQANAAIVLQRAQTALKDALAQSQSVTAAPIQTAPVAVTASSTEDRVKDGLVSLSSILISAMIGIGLTWMRSHMTIMQTAAANDALTKSATGFGAMLVQSMQQRGASIAMLSAHSPEVSSLANSLIAELSPKFTMRLGLSQERAGSSILREAAKVSIGSGHSISAVSPVKAASDALIAEAPKWHLPIVS